jgi:hypothetical protein
MNEKVSIMNKFKCYALLGVLFATQINAHLLKEEINAPFLQKNRMTPTIKSNIQPEDKPEESETITLEGSYHFAKPRKASQIPSSVLKPGYNEEIVKENNRKAEDLSEEIVNLKQYKDVHKHNVKKTLWGSFKSLFTQALDQVKKVVKSYFPF